MHASAAQVARTTKARAFGVLEGALVRDATAHQTVYVVQMQGTFTCATCTALAGAGQPTGRVLTLITEDARNVIFGLYSGKPIDLTTLGTVTNLPN